MAAKMALRPTSPTLPGFYGMPERDLSHTFNEDYAKQYNQLLAEEAAQPAAESPASSSSADHLADSACQLTGPMTTRAAAYGPVSWAIGTKHKLASLLQSQQWADSCSKIVPAGV